MTAVAGGGQELRETPVPTSVPLRLLGQGSPRADDKLEVDPGTNGVGEERKENTEGRKHSATRGHSVGNARSGQVTRTETQEGQLSPSLAPAFILVPPPSTPLL